MSEQVNDRKIVNFPKKRGRFKDTPFTEKVIRELPVGRHSDPTQRGLEVRVTPAGARTYVVRYSRYGKQTQKALGRAGEITLKEARRRAAAAHAAVDGHRPVEGTQTTRQVFETLYWPLRKSQLKRPRDDMSHWSRKVLPFIGHIPLTEVRPDDCALMVSSWGATAGARNFFRVASHFWNWAESVRLVDRSPMPRKPPVAAKHRDRVLTLDEVRKLYRHCREYVPSLNSAPAIMLWLIVTGLRKQEVAELRWSELKGDTIDLAGSRMKNGKPHSCPIVDPLMDTVLKERCPWVFPNGRRNGPYGGQFNGKEGWSVKWAEELGIDPFNPHDLRRTLATHWAELGISDDDLIERQLAHTRKGIAGVYNRSQRLEERRQAMVDWVEVLR
ncbi:tyrosine-type recombinase/integrase [Tateyamaria sp.]|uniref:tyrosine-type recombinase/integrase n=1 Tax=Tateyamaria sp. TaxID=1929288 RepID=UPI0032A02441